MDRLQKLLEELAAEQEKKLLAIGRRILPFLTNDDILQPNDFDELEFNPHFRYEEGVLAGILTVQAAVRAAKKELLPMKLSDAADECLFLPLD